jgi:SseB protein N-terminal domain/SseB protein C-terminal domain
MMTPLDSAFEAAKAHENMRDNFYSLLLNTTLYIPTHDIPAEHEHARADDNTTFNPIIFEHDGHPFLMLFDTIEKLNNWAQRPVGYVGLPGYVIVDISQSYLYWALNAGTNYTKIFVPDEVRWMKANYLDASGEIINLSAGTEIIFGEPAYVPDGMLQQLVQNMSNRNPEIIAAYLAQAQYKREGEKLHLLLVLRLATTDKTIIESIQKDLAMAMKQFIDNGSYIDIYIDDGSTIANEITKSIIPFYER